MYMNKSLVCGALALALVATTVMAQEGRRGGRGPGGRGPGGLGGGMMGGMMGGMGLAGLLRMEKVHEELELVEDQVTDVNAALAEARPAGRRGGGPGAPGAGRGQRGQRGPGGPGGFTPEDRERMMAEMRERENELRKKVADILLPHQMDRLEQIHLQARGITALSEPELQAKLEITDEQKQQMVSTREELETTMRERMREAFQGGGDAEGRQQLMAQMTEMRRDVENKILALLTDDQKKAFEEMKGEAFEFPAPQFGGGGRGGRGGEEGRGGRGGRRGEN